MRAVQWTSVAATLLFGIAMPLRGQATAPAPGGDSTKAVLIHQLLGMTHSVDMAITTIENAIPVQKAANPRIPAVFWDRFLAEARNRRGEFEAIIVDVYDRHFSVDELRQLIAFYQTPVGQKVLSSMPAIMQESTRAGQQWGARLGASIAEQLQSEGVSFTP